MLTKWSRLTVRAQSQVKAAFIYWNEGGYYKTFEDWAKAHAFYVTKQGDLDRRYNHCEPAFMAEGE